ncbi:MAG: efflux RND transporter permease subunit [Lachnospiraceae bacterium]|nr:efflux RND transporter permease subunit [Lachnospiraceae bacterium]
MLGKMSVKKPYTVLVAVVLVVVLGIVSFTKMTTDLLPNISLPYIIVMTTYPGASPETVEMVVTKPVEATMATVSNVEGISSVSGENYSMVMLEFSQGADMNAASLEIRENLDQIKSYWDDSIGSPIIMKMNPDMLPVMIAAVGYTGMDSAQISEMTQNDIIPELESIEGVASASATGLLEESVHVIIRQEKINKINEQVFGAIDEEMKEAEDELAEGRQEIYDGQAELADAKNDIEESKQDLVDSQTELDESRQEILDGQQELADGRAELEQSKIDLEEGKQELEDKRDETAEKLAEAEKEILTAKADLEATKMHITMEISTIKANAEGLSKAKDGLSQIESKASEFGISDASEISGKVDGLNQLKSELQGIKDTLNAMNGSSGGSGDGSSDDDSSDNDSNDVVIGDAVLAGQINTVLSMVGVSTNLTESSSVVDAVDAIERGISAAESNVSSLNTLKSTWDSTASMVEKMEDSLNANTMGIGADAYISQLNSTLEDINNNITQLDSALTELYQGNLMAAIEFANAQTTITLGETQIKSAETQLDSLEEQLESGLEQLDAGQEQIDAGWEQIESGLEQLRDSEEQLADALQQILDGEDELEQAREDAYNQADMHGILTVETIEALLAAQNFSMPAGYVTENGIDYLVRVGDKPDNVEALKAMPLMNVEMDGVDVITLGDVADVFMTDNSADIYANVNGEPGIMITMQKQTGYSTGDVSDKILDKFEELQEADPNLMLITLMDQGIFIDLVMDSIINNVLFGSLLAVIILIIFLKDLRPTAVVACSIPISLIAAVVCMYFSGVTLNVISLSGLALGIGMLVDNSIVVIENIYRLKNEGYSAKEAAIEGAGEVAGAILASTLTTVCVFLPIVFTEGITRQIFTDMGLTIAYSLLASLVVALTVVPAMASKTMRKAKPQKEGKIFGFLMKGYEKILALSLHIKPVILLVVVAALGLSAKIAMSKGTAFMPEMDSTQMTLTLTMPKDTPLSDTAVVSDEIVARLMAVEEVTDVGAMATTSSMSSLTGGGDAATNSTTVYVTLDEEKQRDNKEIAREIDANFADLKEKYQAEISIQTSTMDMSALGGSGISIQVQGRELDTLQRLAKEVAAIVETVEGTTEVSDGLEESTGELRIMIDRDKAIEYGLTVAEIFQQINAKLSDATSATSLQTEIKEYDVYVKNAADMTLTRELVKELQIERKNKEGLTEKIKLSDIATFESLESPDAVNRVDQTRYIAVSALIADGYNVGLVSADVEEALESYEAQMPSGYKLVMTGENETINEALEQLVLMLVLAIVFMYLIMVAQFQSLLSPFIIMFTIPLAFTGGFLGLYLSNSEVSVIAMIGFVMLAGVIVNNGIVLVDYINQLRNDGMPKREAIMEAGRTRMRPVLMTALTTILALSTMAFSEGMGADLSKPMSVVTIGGLIYGTLMTLIVIPCVYDIFNPERKKKVRRVRKVKKVKKVKKTNGENENE